MPLLPRDVGGQGGGIEEAPLDGKLYGRRMARWDPVPTLLTLIYYRGPFATPDELRAAHPTDIPGAYAVVSSTSSIWIWNHDKWEDTGATQTQAGILDAPKDGNTYGRKDGDWVVTGSGTVNEEQVVNIIKNTQHNVLKSIQGGKMEGGQVTEAYHLTKEQWEQLPIRPAVISPANGATNINQVPQIVGTPYAHPYDVPMFAKHIQIAKTNDFTAPVYDKEEFSGTPVFQVPLKPDNSPYLTQDTTYYVRIRYQDRKGRWSHWSAPSQFKTMVQFPVGILLTPVMTLPVDQGQVHPINPVLAMTPPKVAAGTANFDKADWQVSTDSAFGTTIYDAAQTDDLIMHTTRGLNLATSLGAEFFARGRQRTTSGEYTPWAEPVRFGVRPEYDDPVFGVRRRFSRQYKRAFVHHIDRHGDDVFIPKSYFDRHPLYAFARQNVVLTHESPDVVSEMAFVPPCWTKTKVYEQDGDTIIDTWFSASAQTGPGWHLDHAFVKSPNGFFHGTCLTSSAQVRIGGQQKYVPISKPGVSADAERPDQIVNLRSIDSKWHTWTIYERRLLLDLITAEYASLNPLEVSGVFGRGNTIANSMYWRGFFGLFNIHASERYTLPVSGIEWSYTTTPPTINEFRIITPWLNNYISIPTNLPCRIEGGIPEVCATEICTGDNSLLGFDLAILGLVKNVVPNPSGEENSPFGMKNKILIATYEANKKRYHFCPDEMGLFGLAPSYGQSGRCVHRISKWID